MEKYKNGIILLVFSFLLLFLLNTYNVSSAPVVNASPGIGNFAVVEIADTNATISFTVDQIDANTIIHYGTSSRTLGSRSNWNNESANLRTITLTNLTSQKKYYYSIYAYNSTDPRSNSHTPSTNSFVTLNATIHSIPKPDITNNKVTSISNDSVVISFTIDPIDSDTIINYGDTALLGNLSDWNNQTSKQRDIKINNLTNDTQYYYSILAYNSSNLSLISNTSVLNFKTLQTVSTNNTNNTNKTNNTNISSSNVPVVLPNTGNRIWDESKHLNTTYIWNSYSFSGFYYDLDSNLSTENLVISNIQRTIPKGNIVYTTSPVEVDFKHSAYGSYQVIGFMADKYFAGYTSNSTISGKKAMSVIAGGQLQKILFDDDDKRTVSEGGTLTLQQGYVLKLTAVDVGAGPGQILLSLFKDGAEVDNSVVTGGGDYIYSKKVGGVSDLPIIAVHFDSVFRGTEVNAAFIKGLFQISDQVNSLNSGDKYGLMEISGVSGNQISMDNSESVSLSSGNVISLMGNLTIIVANSDTLRFALSVDRTGEYEVRGTIYPVTNTWTPYNFGLNVGTEGNINNIGFYYDLDEDIGTENLQIKSISGTSIPQNGLVYSTSPQEVSFKFPDFGKYQVIGFMADKYFAGYTKNTNPPSPTSSIPTISAISQGELHKILIDDEDKRTISLGGTLTLQDGYVIKAEDIDLNARTMLISLLKDGTEVDSSPLSAGDTYIYEKKVGAINNLPLIMMKFDSVFSGAEVQAAFIKGLFQISEETTLVKTGDDFGVMEISSISANGIDMDNKNSIDLSPGNTLDIMGNIQFKVADSSDVRFYPFVSVTNNIASANQLIVTAPDGATAGDTVNINVTAAGMGIQGASIDIQPQIGKIGITDNNGRLNYTFPKSSSGTFNITASETGYQSGSKNIQIAKYIFEKLNIDIPTVLDQYKTISIKVTANDTAINNATIMFDNDTVGSTDNNGILNYTLNSSGSHTIIASKVDYIPVSIQVDIRAPFSDFRAQDINITPNSTFTNENIYVSSNITNIGTKDDTKSIDLIINGTAVENTTIDLAPNEIKEVNFTYKTEQPVGNYTVQILDQKGELQIIKSPINILFIVAVLTVIGTLIIYILTTKGTKGKMMDTTPIKNFISSFKNKVDKLDGTLSKRNNRRNQ